MLTVLVYAVPSLLSVLLALGLALAGVVHYRLTERVRPQWRLASVVAILGIGALLSIALTSRTLDEDKIAATMGVVATADLAEGFAASRWLSLLLVGASVIEVMRGLVRSYVSESRDAARPILLAMLAYYCGTVLIQAVACDHPEFAPRALYLPIVLAAVYFQHPDDLGHVIASARWCALALMLGSLGGIWLHPDFVMHRPETGWIPGLDWRLFGLAPHANALGPIALLAMVIELHSPARSRLLKWLCLLSAAAVFLLAQSKTSWATVPLMLVFVWLPLALRDAATGDDPASNFRRSVWTLFGAIVVVALMASALVAFDAVNFVEHRSDLVTLSGRTQIWDITLRAWRDNVLFGYGPEIWGPERQREFQMFYVGHAHNQVVQTLGVSGLVGLVLLLGYLGTLLAAAMRNFMASRGMVLVLLMLMLVPGVTEAPMSGSGLLSWTTFLQALLVATACWYARQPRPEPAAARAAIRRRSLATVRHMGVASDR